MNTHAESPPKKISAPNVTYKMKKQRVKSIWQFVVLVPHPVYENMPTHELKSEHAMYAYCQRCKCSIKFEKGQHQVQQHMNKYHMDDLKEFDLKEQKEEDLKKRKLLVNDYSKSNAAKQLKKIPTIDQIKKDFIEDCAHWVAGDNRK